MESSILREGFLEIQNKGAQIVTFVADADANTYPTLQISCDWKIEKIDCENHLSRNIFIYADNWRKDSKEKFADKLYVHNICSTVGKILKHKTNDKNYLEYHLPNVPVHLANIHEKCDVLYCDNDKVSETISIPTSLKKLQEYLLKIAKRAERLRIGMTSNVVESYFAVNGKMQQGKIKNLIQRGTFEYRCYAACLLFNNGPSWSFDLAVKHFNWTGIYFDRQKHEKNLKHIADKKRKLSPDYINKRMTSKFKNQFGQQNVTAYGPYNSDSILNVDDNTEILDSCIKFFENKVMVSLTDIELIQTNTLDQSKSNEWFVERRKRITASNLGIFCKAKSESTVCNVSRRIAYPQREIKTPSIMHGQKYEEIALIKYENLFSKKCEKSGLVIHSKFHFFAASPDAVIKNNGNIDHVIEIKCPYNARSFTENDFKTDSQLAISKRKVKYLNNHGNAFSLVESHDYYYQIQGIMFVTNVQHAELVIYASESDTLLIVPVLKNDIFLHKIINLLFERYFKFYLPEIATNRKLNNQSSFFFTKEFFEESVKPYFCLKFPELQNIFSARQKITNPLFENINCLKQFLDSVLDNKTNYVFLNQTLQETLNCLGLHIHKARGDGHCILHSWAIATGLSIEDLIATIVQDYLNNAELYSLFDITNHELESYLSLQKYTSNTVDSILPILCKTFNRSAYIFSANSHGSTNLQFISPTSNVNSADFLFLLKTDVHYDSLIYESMK